MELAPLTQVMSATSVEPVPATATPLIVLGRFRLGSAPLLPLECGQQRREWGRLELFLGREKFPLAKTHYQSLRQFCC
jgi:hypothetical protein